MSPTASSRPQALPANSGASPGHCPPLALVGPTASGKSAMGLWLARHYPLEIVSVDSALVYRGMDIGTAKPTAAERAQVPHHLIDIRDPAEPYSAAEFAADARRLVADIRSRGRFPLLVGGTFLYLKALLQPLDDLPPAQPALRAALDAEARAVGWPALHAELMAVDPVTAQRLSLNDSQRIGRALEVWRATGRPLSAFHGAGAAPAASGLAPQPLHCPIVSLEPTDRAWLHQRIAQRFDAMLRDGLIDEVAGLMTRHQLPPPTGQRPPAPLHADLPSMRCVGYRQAWEIIEKSEHKTQYSRAQAAIFAEKLQPLGVAATRQLAKRQLTWLRSVPDRWVEACDTPDLPQRVLARARAVWG
jgi:tRNA dimethylallyltransferase